MQARVSASAPRRRLALFGLVLAVTSGCMASEGGNSSAPHACNLALCSKVDEAPAGSPGLALANSGAVSFAEGRFEQSSKQFNQALQIQPENANLHLLNALAYHEQWRAGALASPDLAEAGYLMALKLDTGSALAAAQLGLLYLQAHRYGPASAAFAQAVSLDPSNVDTWYGLAASAYYAHDAVTAAWAAKQALAIADKDPSMLSVAAVASAASGDTETARRYESQLAQAAPHFASTTERVANRWQTAFADFEPAARADKVVLAQADGTDDSGEGEDSGDVFSDEDDVAFAPFPSQETITGGGPGGASALLGADPESGPVQRDWSDCAQSLSNANAGGFGVGGGGPSGGLSNNSQSAQIPERPALPSPCKGMPLPRMAMLDVTLLRSTTVDMQTRGINLLQGLQLVLYGSTSYTTSPDTYVASGRTKTGEIALPVGGITYALNIANATVDTSDILLRPSLISLDRQPSTFFAGYNVDVLVGGGGYSSGSLVQRKVGMTLAITPTFIDNNSMLLTVRVSRDYPAANMNTGSLNAALTTSSNEVSASVRINFDQTLVLSGFRASDVDTEANGVPVLQDIPLVKSVFSQRSKIELDENVIIVITPRRPKELDGSADASADLSGSDFPTGNGALSRIRRDALKDFRAHHTNSDAVLRKLQSSILHPEFRTGDVNMTELESRHNLGKAVDRAWDGLRTN